VAIVFSNVPSPHPGQRALDSIRGKFVLDPRTLGTNPRLRKGMVELMGERAREGVRITLVTPLTYQDDIARNPKRGKS